MDIRNLLNPQSIRQKLLVGTMFLAIVPVALTSLIVGREALISGRESLEAQARDSLVAIRTTKASQISDYFNSLSNNVQVLAQMPMVVSAMRDLPAAMESAVPADTDLAAERAQLNRYYTGDFLQEYQRRNFGRAIDMTKVVSTLPNAAAHFQNLYISANPNPLGQKNNLDRANDNSRYSELHNTIHPFLRTALTQYALYDIFLVEPQNGTIVYTQFKELDYATSLVNGPYAQTRLGEAFRAAVKLDKPGLVALSEFGEYLPSYNDQASFLATPIFDGARKVGVFIVQVPIDKINSIMTHERKWRDNGLGESGETYLVSADGTPRSVSRFAVEDIDAFAKTALAAGLPQTAVNTMIAKKTTIGLLPVKTEGAQNALANKTGTGIYPDYRKQRVFGAYAPLDVLGLKWSILAEIDEEEALRPVASLRQKVLLWSGGIAAALLALGLWIAFTLLRAVTRPLGIIQATVTQVAGGDYAARTGITTRDEFGSLGGAFDNLLDDRVAHLADAERENDDLNDSVVQLLQAVAQLSQKDLTAKAPVTANVIGTVSDSINLLTTETSKVLSEVTQIAGQVKLATERVKRQADSVNATASAERADVTRATENLKHASKIMAQVSELAVASNVAAEQATSSTSTALSTVNETVRGMQNIRESIAESEKRIKRLGERSQEISGIVNLINTIAERTHVLALNASMQAAAAGDAGRGFAVVAEEVQRLAESSRQATQQISQLVSNIQIETSDTINTVNKTISQVVTGSELAVRSGEQMRTTQEATTNLVDLVKRIATSADLQVRIANELRQRVNQIGASTEKTAAEILLQAEATSDLTASADRLVQSVGVFKLPSDERAVA
jgi:methyl-accepting chemotaxis protein